MKKIISLFLSIIIAVSFTSCSKKITEDVPENPNKINDDYYITLSDNSKRYLSYGDTVNLYENQTDFQKIGGGEKETIKETCKGPFGVKPGDSLDSLISAFNVKEGSAALLYSNDGYVNYNGDVNVEEGKMGCMYFAYGITASGAWTEFTFDQIQSLFLKKLGMSDDQKLVIIGASFDSTKKLLNIGVITGTFKEINVYITK